MATPTNTTTHQINNNKLCASACFVCNCDTMTFERIHFWKQRQHTHAQNEMKYALSVGNCFTFQFQQRVGGDQKQHHGIWRDVWKTKKKFLLAKVYNTWDVSACACLSSVNSFKLFTNALSHSDRIKACAHVCATMHANFVQLACLHII